MHADEALRAFRLDGAVAAITGGARGIGRTTAELFASVGARVVLLDLNREAAREAAQKIGSSATAHSLDVAKESEVDVAFVYDANYDVRLMTTEMAGLV